MKLDSPVLPPGFPEELRIWMVQVTDLVNQGLYIVKEFTSAPALGDMDVGEIGFGDGTGAGSAHEIFLKVSSTTIARFTHDATIT